MNEKEMLIAAILALSSVIAWLAVYISKLHKRSLDMATKFSDSSNQLKSAIDALSKSVDNNTTATGDLHRFILKSFSNLIH